MGQAGEKDKKGKRGEKGKLGTRQARGKRGNLMLFVIEIYVLVVVFMR
jgi:hypothetical protein